MRIILTNSEAEAYLADKFKDATIEIESDVNGYKVEDFLRSPIEVNQKIASIKRLRELIPGLTLGSAKYMVEAFMTHGRKTY